MDNFYFFHFPAVDVHLPTHFSCVIKLAEWHATCYTCVDLFKILFRLCRHLVPTHVSASQLFISSNFNVSQLIRLFSAGYARCADAHRASYTPK